MIFDRALCYALASALLASVPLADALLADALLAHDAFARTTTLAGAFACAVIARCAREVSL